jgi:hypothetical protein
MSGVAGVLNTTDEIDAAEFVRDDRGSSMALATLFRRTLIVQEG